MRDTAGTGTPAMVRFLQKFPQLQWLLHVVLNRCMRLRMKARTVFYSGPPPQQVGLHATANVYQGKYLRTSGQVIPSVRDEKLCKTVL